MSLHLLAWPSLKRATISVSYVAALYHVRNIRIGVKAQSQGEICERGMTAAGGSGRHMLFNFVLAHGLARFAVSPLWSSLGSVL